MSPIPEARGAEFLKILVTGGAGFIGSEFVRSLLQQKYDELGLSPKHVTVIDALTYAGSLENLKSISSDGRFEFVHGNITDFDLMLKLTRDCDLIFNFAAESHVDRSIENPAIFIETNVLGTYTVLEVAKQNKVKRVVQVSTDEVYGSIEKGSWNEESPLKPNSPYSASKASGDLLARSYFKTFGLDVVVTRSCNNYGPYQHIEKLIPQLITRILNDKPLPIYGDGSNIREWIHVSDHSRAIAFISLNGVAGEIYNIGSSDELTNLEIANWLLELVPSSKSKINLVADRLGHDFRYSLNKTKLSGMGFDGKIQLSRGLEDTLEFYEEFA